MASSGEVVQWCKLASSFPAISLCRGTHLQAIQQAMQVLLGHGLYRQTTLPKVRPATPLRLAITKTITELAPLADCSSILQLL